MIFYMAKLKIRQPCVLYDMYSTPIGRVITSQGYSSRLKNRSIERFLTFRHFTETQVYTIVLHVFLHVFYKTCFLKYQCVCLINGFVILIQLIRIRRFTQGD